MQANNFVKILRKKAGITQNEVADWIGVERTGFVRREKEGNKAFTANEFLIIINKFKEYLPSETLIEHVLDLFDLREYYSIQQNESKGDDVNYTGEYIEYLKKEIAELKQKLEIYEKNSMGPQKGGNKAAL